MDRTMATTIDFSDSGAQRDWHAKWPRWINALLAYHYVIGEEQTTPEGAAALRATLLWLRGSATDEEVTRAMKAAFEVSPIRAPSGGDRAAMRAACVSACAANPSPETVFIFPPMCISNPKACAKRATEVLEWLGPLTGPDDQLVAMDRLEELGVLPTVR